MNSVVYYFTRILSFLLKSQDYFFLFYFFLSHLKKLNSRLDINNNVVKSPSIKVYRVDNIVFNYTSNLVKLLLRKPW